MSAPEKKKKQPHRDTARASETQQEASTCPRFFGPILAVASARVFSLKNRSLSEMPLLDLLIWAPSFAQKPCSPGIDSAARRTTEAGVSAKLPRQVEMES